MLTVSDVQNHIVLPLEAPALTLEIRFSLMIFLERPISGV